MWKALMITRSLLLWMIYVGAETILENGPELRNTKIKKKFTYESGKTAKGTVVNFVPTKPY